MRNSGFGNIDVDRIRLRENLSCVNDRNASVVIDQEVFSILIRNLSLLRVQVDLSDEAVVLCVLRHLS